MTRIVAIPLLALAALSTCLASDDAAPASKIEVAQRFMRALLTEDAKALSELTDGGLQRDFRTYFWLRGAIHNGEKPSVAPKAVGALRIDVQHVGRVETMSADFRSKDEVDCCRVVVADKAYKVCVDDLGKVVSVDDDDQRVTKSPPRK